MGDIIATLQGTPLPAILIICGVILLLLAVVTHFSRYAAVYPRARIWSGVIGGCLLVGGVFLQVLGPDVLGPDVSEPDVSEPDVLKPIPIAVDSYARNKNVAVGVLPELYGEGVLSPKKNYSVGDSWVEYEFYVERSATYSLWIRYASEESRPVRIKLNGDVINDKGLSETMAGWNEPQWAPQGTVGLEKGDHVLRLEREGAFENAYMPFPAIHSIEFRPP
jgi:hypothetical protein